MANASLTWTVPQSPEGSVQYADVCREPGTMLSHRVGSAQMLSAPGEFMVQQMASRMHQQGLYVNKLSHTDAIVG
jgi:hypothetical protein